MLYKFEHIRASFNLRLLTYIEIIVSTIGYAFWFYLIFKLPEYPIIRTLVGAGFGFCYGAAMVYWVDYLKQTN